MTVSKLAFLCVAFAGTGSSAPSASACETATMQNNPECFRNVEWAMTKGIKEDPTWYKNFTFLKPDSSFETFQLAMSMPGGLKGFNCSIPCGFTPEQIDAVAQAVEADAEAKGNIVDEAMTEQKVDAVYGAEADKPGTKTTPPPPDDSWGIMTWLMICVGICCVLPMLGLCCSAFICYESVAWIFGGSDKPEKAKKRSVKVTKKAAEPLVPPTPAMAPMPVNTFAQPMAVAGPMPMYAHAQPGAPIAMHAPVYTTAQPVVTTAPPVYMQAPPMAMPVRYA
jgi:hypothetical protein